MIELLLNTGEIPSFYSIYLTFLIGISGKIIWSWVSEDSFITTLSNSTKLSIYELPDNQLELQEFHKNEICQWLTKFIRLKQCPNDDGEDHFLLFVC